MATPKESYYEKRAQILIRNLERRHFEAYYVPNKEEALVKVMELLNRQREAKREKILEQSEQADVSDVNITVGWGGSATVKAVGVIPALEENGYETLDRDKVYNPEKRVRVQKRILAEADTFVTGCNALSLDGQMVTIDDLGNRVAAISYGPESVIVVVGMNKVTDDLDSAIKRARTYAAPMNKQRFTNLTACSITGVCADCHSIECICNQVLVTRNCRPCGRIKFVLIGEDMGF